MDAEKVQHQPRDGKERWDVVLVERMAVEQAQFIHGSGSLFCLHAAEADDGCSAGNELNNLIVQAFELPGIAARGLAQGVKPSDGVGGHGQFFVPGVDFIQRHSVTLHFLLRTVAGFGVSQDQRTETFRRDRHALDAIGRFGALNDGRLPESLKHLRRLAGKQLLFAFGFGNVVEQPRRAHGQRVVSQAAVAKGHHRWGNALPRGFKSCGCSFIVF